MLLGNHNTHSPILSFGGVHLEEYYLSLRYIFAHVTSLLQAWGLLCSACVILDNILACFPHGITSVTCVLLFILSLKSVEVVY